MTAPKPALPLRGLPSVRQLRAFVAVYQSGHVSAAAEMLSVTQPAVTVLLREFEDRLGVRLFERTTRTLRRTDAAAEAYAYAQRALAELESLTQAMADFSGSRTGRLRVAATSTVVQTLLPGLLRAFTQAHPDVQLIVDDCPPGEFVERIAGERVDCGIGTLETAVPGLVEHVFLHDSLVAVALPSVFGSDRALSWKQLAAFPVITVKPGYGVRRQIDRAAVEAGVHLHVAHEVSLLTTALALASGGLGVAGGAGVAPPAAARLGALARLSERHQNCHCPEATTQMPRAPLVTAWAITAVHSRPVPRYSSA